MIEKKEEKKKEYAHLFSDNFQLPWQASRRWNEINQCGITCGAIVEPSRSSKAIDKRVIIYFCDKNDFSIFMTKCHDMSWFVWQKCYDMSWCIMTFCHKNKKTSFLWRKRAITSFLSQKFMITRLSIAFEDFPGSSIASQVMPPWCSQQGKRLWRLTLSDPGGLGTLYLAGNTNQVEVSMPERLVRCFLTHYTKYLCKNGVLHIQREN